MNFSEAIYHAVSICFLLRKRLHQRRHCWETSEPSIACVRIRNQEGVRADTCKKEKEDDVALPKRVFAPRRNGPCGSCSLSQRQYLHENARCPGNNLPG